MSEIVIDLPRDRVAEYVTDPANSPTWYVNIESVEWQTPPPLVVGSRLAFVAHFLNRRLAYTYEIVELVPGERLVMRTAQGPFPMETTYTWQSQDDGCTLRNRGEPSGLSKVGAPLMAVAMRRANRKDRQPQDSAGAGTVVADGLCPTSSAHRRSVAVGHPIVTMSTRSARKTAQYS
jgi:uncharacterized protein YndB with AHSA1/START domain